MVVTASLFSRALDPFALTHWKSLYIELWQKIAYLTKRAFIFCYYLLLYIHSHI